MSTSSTFFTRVLADPDLAQLSFRVTVLDRYLTQSGSKVTRTDTVGRVKAESWTLDFGIAADEETIHLPLGSLKKRLPEVEREHWLAYIAADLYSQNYLKMQSSHSCIDDGNFRNWGEEPLF